jgi:hypothetical protein
MATLHKIEDRCGAVELRVRLYQQRDGSERIERKAQGVDGGLVNELRQQALDLGQAGDRIIRELLRDVRGRMAFWEEMAREWSVSKGTTYRPDRLRMRYRRLKKEKACGYVPG